TVHRDDPALAIQRRDALDTIFGKRDRCATPRWHTRQQPDRECQVPLEREPEEFLAARFLTQEKRQIPGTVAQFDPTHQFEEFAGLALTNHHHGRIMELRAGRTIATYRATYVGLVDGFGERRPWKLNVFSGPWRRG